MNVGTELPLRLVDFQTFRMNIQIVYKFRKNFHVSNNSERCKHIVRAKFLLGCNLKIIVGRQGIATGNFNLDLF